MKRNCIGAAVISLFILGGCTHTSSSTSSTDAPLKNQYSGQQINPTSGIKLAQVYRTREKANTSGRYTLVNLCADDFKMTKKLSDIATKYSDPSGDARADDTQSKNWGWDAKLGGVNIGPLSVGGGYSPSVNETATYKNVTYYQVEDADLQTVTASIGPSCRDLIAEHLKANEAVFIVSGAYKGDIDITLTKSQNPSADAGIKIANISPNFHVGYTSGSTAKISGKQLFFQIDTEPAM